MGAARPLKLRWLCSVEASSHSLFVSGCPIHNWDLRRGAMELYIIYDFFFFLPKLFFPFPPRNPHPISIKLGRRAWLLSLIPPGLRSCRLMHRCRYWYPDVGRLGCRYQFYGLQKFSSLLIFYNGSQHAPGFKVPRGSRLGTCH